MVVDRLAHIRTSGRNPVTESQYGPSWQWPQFSIKSNTGLTVTNEKALGLTAAYRGVVLLSSLPGALPIDVFAKGTDGQRVDAADESNAYLWRRPNSEMTRQTFWECSFGQEVLGNCFWFVEKDINDQPRELWPIESDRMKVGRLKNGTKVYEIDNELPMIDYRDGGEIVHIPNWSRDGLLGLNPFKLGAEALSIGLSAQEYAARFYSQADAPPGYLTTDQLLTEPQAEAISNRWHKMHAGLTRALRSAVLGGGAKFLTTGIDPNSAQLHEARKYSVLENARLLGLPPNLLGDMDHSSQGGGNGVEEMNRGLMTFTVNAHITRFELAADGALLVRELTGRYCKFNTSALLRGNTLQRFQAYRLANFMTANEKRALEDLPPMEGGDVLMEQQNMAPLDAFDGMKLGQDQQPSNGQ